MVKTPRTRHSKSERGPVTIDLTANESLAAEPEKQDAQAAEEPMDPAPEASSDPAPRQYYVDEDVPETVLDRPVEDRIEDEAALTGKAGGYAAAEAAQSPPAPQPSRGGWASHLAAGVIGGILAAGAGWALQPGASAPDTGATEALRGEVAALKTEIDGLKSVGAVSGDLAATVEQLRSEVASLQAAVQTGGGDAAALAALNDKLTTLETALGSLSAADGQSAELASRIVAVEQSVASLIGKVDSQTAQPKIALAIASAGLKSAVERGAPFSAELETFAAIAPNLPHLEALRGRAAAGVPSRADLARAFPDAANAMAAAASPVAEDAGFFQRLFSSAQSVVQVRPVGEVPGDEPGARIARMEVAVNAGAYAKALAEFDALPDAVKAAGAGVVDQIRARAEVETQVDQLIAEAMKTA